MAEQDLEYRTRGPVERRRFWRSPVLLVVGFLATLASILWLVHDRSRGDSRRRLDADATQLIRRTEFLLDGNRDYLITLATARSRGKLPAADFQSKASEYVKSHPELINITWVGPQFVVEDVAPLDGNRQILGLSLSLSEPSRASRRARDTKSSVYTDVFQAIQGGSSFEIWVPVFQDERFLGLFAAVYSCSDFFNAIIEEAPAGLSDRCRIELTSAGAGVVASTTSDRSIDETLLLVRPITPRGQLGVRVARLALGVHLAYGLLIGACVVLAIAIVILLTRQQAQLFERERAERALRESEERSRAILQAFPDLVLSLNERYEIVEYHSHSRPDPALNVVDAIGKPIASVFPESVGRKFESLGRAARISGETHVFEFRLGDELQLVYECRLVRSAGKLLAIIRNITARKRVEDELAKYRDDLETLVAKRTRELKTSRLQLEAAERLASMGTLAAGIAHEINNPIGAILLAAQSAVRKGADRTSELELIVSEAKRCGRIVKSMLQFARQETTEKWPGDVNPIVERALELMRRSVSNRGAKLELRLDPIAKPVLLNPIEIEQIVTNLVENALDAGSERITVSTHTTPERVRIMVVDDGQGMNAATRERAFEPFYTTRQGDGGHGLGLSIVHGIVSEHRGVIEIQSELGVGSTFIIDLPVCEPSLVPS